MRHMKHLEMKISAASMIKQECQVMINSKQAKEDHLVVDKEVFLVLKAFTINSVKAAVLNNNKEGILETFSRNLKSSLDKVVVLGDNNVALVSVVNNKLKGWTLW